MGRAAMSRWGTTAQAAVVPENREASIFRDALVPFANWLYFQTRGQPLYLVETLKGLLAREIIVPSLQENGSWGLVLRAGLLAQTPVGDLIPSSLRELIRSQLARLTPSAWALLVAGAVLRQGLTFERLIQVAQLDEQEGLRALEELLRNGLLCEGHMAEESQAFDGICLSSRDDPRGGVSGGRSDPPTARAATCVGSPSRAFFETR